ncbi:MAG TPA: ABC transporter ATP-binding protein [bacterium]|nr:ABC transporter ATP-binding protein [bacterium]
MNPSCLSVQNLRFRYVRDDVLNDLAFDVRSGEILALLGPNASGKTTLLKNMAGLLHPSSGRVLMNGIDLTDRPHRERARAIAFVPQSEDTFLDFSAEQTVLMGRAPYVGTWGFESAEDRAKTREAMERTDTWILRERGLSELSGGERQRVILARALAQEAKLLLLDEPTSHLDVRYQKEILDLCASLNAERGLTVVMTLHDLNLAALYAHRLLLLKEGKVVRLGFPAETLTEETISEVFSVPMKVVKDEKSGLPSSFPIR